jgi:hypothetical protein
MRSTMLSTHLRNYVLWKQIGVPKNIVDWERPQSPKLIIYYFHRLYPTLWVKNLEFWLKKTINTFCAFWAKLVQIYRSPKIQIPCPMSVEFSGVN